MTRPMLNGTLMFPNEYLAAEELEQDMTFTVRDAKFDDLQTRDGSKERKPVLFFNETKKKLVLNKTNATQIAKLHGSEARDWTGKQITLYATTCQAFGQTVDCIRVRSKTAAASSNAPTVTEVATEATGAPEPDKILHQLEQHLAVIKSTDKVAAKRTEAKAALKVAEYPTGDDPAGVVAAFTAGEWVPGMEKLIGWYNWQQEQKSD